MTLNLIDAEATRDAGRQWATRLPGFAVLVLTGPLGAGKTTFTQGLAEGWGVAAVSDVTSPSYTLIHEYRRGTRTLYHIDLYRLDTTAQFATLGLDDILAAPPAGEEKCVVIEWGEKVESELPQPYLKLDIAERGDGRKLSAAWVPSTPTGR